jgi:hypothetical protein
LYNLFLFLFFASCMLCLGKFLFANIKLKCCKLRLIDFFEDKISQSEIIISYKYNVNWLIVSSKCKEEKKYSNLKV